MVLNNFQVNFASSLLSRRLQAHGRIDAKQLKRFDKRLREVLIEDHPPLIAVHNAPGSTLRNALERANLPLEVMPPCRLELLFGEAGGVRVWESGRVEEYNPHPATPSTN